MSDSVIPALALPSLPVAGGGTFPVGRILCVGKNYAAHAREMGEAKATPFWFTKSLTAIRIAHREPAIEIAYPPHTTELHHEVELVVAMGGGGAGLAPSIALPRVYGYAVGLDLTRRDLQREAKQAGRPWAESKDFDGSAPVGLIHPASMVGHLGQGRISLTCNGELRQAGDLSHMTLSVAEIIARMSTSFSIRPGDLIFTGTPAGVGPLEPGDLVEGSVEGLPGKVTVRIGD